MAEQSLKKVLKECKTYAKTGYDIAASHRRKLDRSLSDAQDTLEKTISDFNSSPFYSPETAQMLRDQLSEINASFFRLSSSFSDDLNDLYSRLSDFTITLFGRTMAGKSTLMEILTEGDGSAIGNGSQRKTRDIRTYEWNGLSITDVPGIGAFEGQEDEDIAYHAAKRSDLILFLITDDGPQPTEAEWCGRIISLGKPVIFIMNVKMTIDEAKSLKTAQRDIEKKFDMEELEKVRSQFLQYAVQFGQSWEHIPFIYVHLLSAYLAQHTSFPERAGVYQGLSRIDDLKAMITEQVQTKGCFYRIKTFIDIISNPMLETFESLLAQSFVNSTQRKLISDKKIGLENWKTYFRRDAEARISALIARIKQQLNSSIAEFTEEHFADENAGKEWNTILKRRRIESRCQELMEDLENEVNEKISEFMRELESELKYSSSFTENIYYSNFRMHRLIDDKKIWDWGVVIVGGGLGLAAGITALIGGAVAVAAGPLGWAALGVGVIGGLGSMFFKSREKKEQEARGKLEKILRENVDDICNSLTKSMHTNLDTLIFKRIDYVIYAIDSIINTLQTLADTQRNISWIINKDLAELNQQIVLATCKMTNVDISELGDFSSARIPGIYCFIIHDNRYSIPDKQMEKLSAMMDEEIVPIYNEGHPDCLIANILGHGIDARQIIIEENNTAKVPFNNPSPDRINRIRIAQQASACQIIKQ